jgi:hypothetical protein
VDLRELPKTWPRSLLGAAWLILLGVSTPLYAQVRLASGVAQVALVAHSEPRGSILGIGPAQETSRASGVRQVSVSVRLSVNTGYRLLVQGNDRESSRVSVLAADGTFQPLMPGSSVVVARGSHGRWERTVQYRIETPEGVESAEALPVRYDLAIDPTI